MPGAGRGDEAIKKRAAPLRGRPVRVYMLFKVVAFPTLRGVGPCLVMSAGLPLDRAVAEVVGPLPLGKRGVEDAPARVLGEWSIPNGTTGILCHNVLLALRGRIEYGRPEPPILGYS